MSFANTIGTMLRPRTPSRRDWLMMLVGGIVVLGAVGIFSLTHQPPLPLEARDPVNFNISWLPETVKRWRGPINEMAKKYNIDPNVLAILMTLESGGYSQAESHIGAKGLMQITAPTAQDIASKYLQTPLTEYDLYDPRTNIEFGAAYVAYLRDEFGESNQGPSWDGTVELIAAGYNGGPGAAGKLYRGEGLTSSETAVYSRDALNMWRERHAARSPTFDRWVERGGSTLLEKAKAEQRNN